MKYRILRLLTVAFALLAGSLAFAQTEYKVRSGDALVIEVLEDPSLNRTVVVLPDGRFSFPFAGSVPARGRTVLQVQNAIISGISGNFAAPPTVFVSVQPAERSPVTVTAAEPETINIYFLGEVTTPGLRAVEPGTTFMQAIAQSGGFTRFAATKRIQLRRTNAKTGQQSVQSFNYKALSEGAALTRDTRLRDGDVILVPERRLFE